MSRGAGLAARLYRWLIRAYPRDFRERFGERMVEDFRHSYEERCRETGLLRGAVNAWLGVLVDTAVAAVRQHRDARSRRAESMPGSPPGQRGGDGMGRWISDLRTTGRALVNRPGFSLVAVGTLALAIGANTMLFSVLDGVLLRPLPYPHADRLVLLSESRDGSNGVNNVSYPNYLDWREGTSSFEEMGAVAFASVSLTGGSEPLRVTMGRADPAFMHAAGLEPMLGRGFLDEENVPGARPVVILSHAIWSQSFGADPDLVGGAIQVNGVPTEVIGILAEGADFAEAGIAVWFPIVPSIGNWAERREVHALTVLARLRDGVSTESAREDLARVGERLVAEYPDSNAGRGASFLSLRQALLGDVSTSVWLLMATVGLVLLIACANVANLILVRFTARRQEFGLRRALGARPADLVRLHMTEALLLTVSGGVIGTALAYLSIGPAVHLLRGKLPWVADVHVDAAVLAFALALSVGTGIVVGILPMLGSGSAGLDARSGGTSTGTSRRTARARATLSTLQVAGSVILLVGAGLLVRSLSDLQSVDVGFDPDNLATTAVSLSGTGRSTEEVVEFFRELPERIASIPGVRAASGVNALPISGGDSNGTVTIEGRTFAAGEAPTASFRRILPDYFETVGTPLLYGRDFQESDRGEPMVTIINESMARALWDHPADAVGARIKVGSPDFEPWLTVVGVAGDVRNVGLDVGPRLATYEPHAQRPWTTMSLVFRTEGDPATVRDAVRSTIQQAGGEVPVYDFTTLNERIAESLRPRRIAVTLTLSLAILALVIASVGVYGVLSYSVSQRTRELGVKIALGAGATRVMGTVGLQAVRMIGGGLAIGLVGALALGNTLGSLLYGVGPRDAQTFIAVPVVLAVVGAVACYVPARRAMRIDPAESLRQE